MLALKAFSVSGWIRGEIVPVTFVSTKISTYLCLGIQKRQIYENGKLFRTELRSNLKHYLDGVVNDNEPLLVHRAGNESVVVISLDEYNAIKETEYIMKSPAMMEAIRNGENEIKQGKGTRISIDELWK